MDVKPPDMAVFERLREQAGITQQDAAKLLLGVSRVTYHNWLKKDVVIRAKKHRRIKVVMLALARCLKSDRLPVDQMVGNEKRTTSLTTLLTEIKAIGN